LQPPFYNKQTARSLWQFKTVAESRGTSCPQRLHVCVGGHAAMQAHSQQEQQLYQPDTHTHGLFLSARSICLGSALCQHMHSLGLASSEPTGCLFTELPHNTAMISLTLSVAQPSMQSTRPSTVPPPSCFLFGF